MDIKVSVIIPCYNVERFLQDCIDSLLAQTLQEIEFIFVNDASPDNSLQILLENQRKYPDKIKVIDLKENLRQGGARNKGIELAKGKYIGFVDSDDLVLPSMFEDLFNRAVETEADAVFCGIARVSQRFSMSARNTVLKDLKQFKQHRKVSELDNKLLNDKNRMDLLVYSLFSVTTGIWKKGLLMDNRLFFPEKLKFEDNYWCSLVCCYLNRVAFVNKVGYLYRKNIESTVNVRNNISYYDRIVVERQLLSDLKQRNFFEKHFDVWEYIYTFRYVFNTMHALTSRFDKPDTHTIRMLVDDLKKNFPLWYNNRFLCSIKSKRSRLRYYLIVRHTRLYCKYITIKNAIKNFLYLVK